MVTQVQNKSFFNSRWSAFLALIACFLSEFLVEASEPCEKILSLLGEQEIVRVEQKPVRHQYPESEAIGEVISNANYLKVHPFEDGHYIALLDRKGNLIASKRHKPKSLGSETYLVTHGNLEQKMILNDPSAEIVAALEFRVLNGQLYYFNDKSGRFRGSEAALRKAIARAEELNFPFSRTVKTFTESVGPDYRSGRIPVNDLVHLEAGLHISNIHRMRANPKTKDLIDAYEGIFNYLGKFEFFHARDYPGSLDLQALEKSMSKGKESYLSSYGLLAGIHSSSIADGIEYGVLKVGLHRDTNNLEVLRDTKMALIEFARSTVGRKIGVREEDIKKLFPGLLIARIGDPTSYPERAAGVRTTLRNLYREISKGGVFTSKPDLVDISNSRQSLEKLIQHVQNMETPELRSDFLLKILNGEPYSFQYVNSLGGSSYEITFQLPKSRVVETGLGKMASRKTAAEIWGVPDDYKLFEYEKVRLVNAIDSVHGRIDLTMLNPFEMNVAKQSLARKIMELNDFPDPLIDMALDLGVLGLNPKRDIFHKREIFDFSISRGLNIDKVQEFFERGNVSRRILRWLAEQKTGVNNATNLDQFRIQAIECLR